MLQNGTNELKGVSLLSGPISWRGVGGLGRGGGRAEGCMCRGIWLLGFSVLNIYIYTYNGVRFKLLSLQFCKILLITFPALIRTSLPEREKKHPFSSQEGKPRGTTIWRTPTVLKPAYSNFICLSESPPVL